MSKPQFGEPLAIVRSVSKNDHKLCTREGKCLARADDENDLVRLARCVNACAGLSDEELTRVRAVNELYESLREVLPYAQSRLEAFGVKPTDPEWEPLKVASRALALAEGTKARWNRDH